MLIIHVKSHNLYKDSLDVPVLRQLMEFSELPANHLRVVGDPNCLNNRILGKFKVMCNVILFDVIAQ